MECNDKMVQIAAIAGLTALGSVCIIFDGEIGNLLAIAIAGALGLIAPSIFPRRPVNASKEEIDG